MRDSDDINIILIKRVMWKVHLSDFLTNRRTKCPGVRDTHIKSAVLALF